MKLIVSILHVSLFQGWEEIVDTTLTHQLRTKLAKTVKDQNVNIEMLGVGSDTDKIKKHIAIFVERLAKGIRLSDSNNTKTGILSYAINLTRIRL